MWCPLRLGTSSTGDRGWVAVAKANDRRSVLLAARRLECTAARQLAKLGWCVTKALARSKQEFLCSNVEETSTSPLQWRHGGIVSDPTAVGQESTTAGQVLEE